MLMTMKFLVALLIVAPSCSFAMNLQEYLNAVSSKHKTIQSLDVQKEAADLRKEAGDISLVPVLQANAFYSEDKSPTNQWVSFGADESKSYGGTLGLSKSFSSGTNVALSAQAAEFQNPGLNPLLGDFQKFGTGSLGVSISQSLWKDFFGEATRMRWATQDMSNAAEKGSYDLQKKSVMVQAEMAFWDYLYSVENVSIARDSLERSRRIETWTRRRVNDGISEKADLLQSQALVASRQLALIAVEDDLASAKQSLRDYLELEPSEPLPAMTGDISKSRPLSSMVDGSRGRVVALEAYLASLDAKAKELAARQVDENYKPDLVLSGSYQTNSKENDLPAAAQKWGDTNRPTEKIGLNFTYMFDTDVKEAARNSSKKDALAAKLQSERKALESESSWVELNRRYSELSKRVEAATQVVGLQESRAKAQADLFNKGRSITNDVVNAEEDAGTAKLNLSRLKSEQRKMEAQGRLYIAIEDK